ncbi:hypothetical protein ACTG9Q_15525 [Actinokineospora sp. 24-640]
MRLPALAALCAAGFSVIAASPAAAGEDPGPVVSRQGGVVTVVGSAGADDITVDGIRSGPFAFLVVTVDTDVPVQAGPGCAALSVPGSFGCGVHTDVTGLDIRAGAGDDRVTWFVPAVGSVNGGDGDDRFRPAPDAAGFTSGSGVRLNGRLGADEVDYSGAARGVTVSIGAGADDGRGGDHDDVQSDVERVVGTPFADHIAGTGRDETITPGMGLDTVLTAGGHDWVHAADGAPDDIDCGGGLYVKVDADLLDDLLNCL